MRRRIAIVKNRFYSLVLYSDTTPTRFFLALTATIWVVGLLVPGDTMSRPVYRSMGQIMGLEHQEMKWLVWWTLVSGGLWWRAFSAVPRPWWALTINTASCLSFTASTYSILWSAVDQSVIGPFPAGVAPNLACMMASIWVLIRTHVNSEPGWRND